MHDQLNDKYLLYPQQSCDHVMMILPSLRTNFTQATKSNFIFVIKKDTGCFDIPTTTETWYHIMHSIKKDL